MSEWSFYEREVVAVEEYVVREASASAAWAIRIDEGDIDVVVEVFKKLRSLGYNVIPDCPSDSVFKSRLKSYYVFNQAELSRVLNELRGAVVNFILTAISALNYWFKYYEERGLVEHVVLYAYRAALDELGALLQRASGAVSPRELLSVLNSAISIYDKYRVLRVDVNSVLRDYEGVVEHALSKTPDPESRGVLEQYKSAINLLRDKQRLLDLLTRFFILMDMVRDETYNLYMATYTNNKRQLRALINIINDKASFEDVFEALSGAHLLLVLYEKGALDVEKLFPIRMEASYRYRYERYSDSIMKGEIPDRQPLGVVQLAETLSQINPLRHVWNLTYGFLKNVLPENIAQYVATGVSSTVFATVGSFTPPIAAGLAVLTVLDGVLDVSSRLSNPVDREVFSKFLQEHWQEVLVNTAVAVLASAGTSLALAKVKPIVYGKIADVVEKVSPGLAARIREAVSPTVIVGRPVYRERDVVITVTDDGELHVYSTSAGRVEVVYKVKIPERTVFTLQDPQVKLALGSLVSRRGFFSVGVVGDDLVFLGDDGLVVVSPRGVVSVTEGTKYAPLFTAAKASPETFKLYYVAQSFGISQDDLLSLNPYLAEFARRGGVFGEVNVKGVVFEFKGDVLFIRSGVKTIATVDLKGFNADVLRSLVSAGEEFIRNYGRGLYSLVLNNIAFGYGLLSPQTVSIVDLLSVIDTSAVNLSDVLPPVQRAIGVYGAVGKLQFYASKQLLDAGFEVKTTVVREVVDRARAILGSRFRELEHTVIRLPPEVAGYISAAKSSATSPLNLVFEAARLASRAGDTAARDVLLNLYYYFQLVDLNLATIQLAVSSSSETAFIISAVQGALLGASTAVVHAISRGDTTTATSTLTNALLQAGFSQQTASQIAGEIVRRLTGVREQVLEVVIPVSVEHAVLIPTLGYDLVEQYSVVNIRDVMFTVPVVREVEVVVPVVEYDLVEQYSGGRGRNLAVIVPVKKEDFVLALLVLYEPAMVYTAERLRDVVFTVPVVQQEEVSAPISVYELEERSALESTRGLIIQVEESAPLIIASHVDIEEEIPVPAHPQPPHISAPSHLPLPPGALTQQRQIQQVEKQPKGRGEIEVLVY